MSKKKTNSKPTQPCVECHEGTMTFKKKKDTLEYKGHRRQVSLEGYWCDTCGEAIFDGPALRARGEAFRELKAKVDGTLTAEQVKQIREKLKLTQVKAGELLGGGPRSFQKYESGEVGVSAPMSNLLRLLSNDPSRLKELQS